jgi:hypothetical protein
MPFRCPECLSASLETTRSIELPPDSRSDEITLQVMACSSCGFRALAVYEESRRGALDSEAWDFNAYRVGLEVVESVAASIEACPAPGNPRCPCPVHQALGKADDRGRWQGPQGLNGGRIFPVERI